MNDATPPGRTASQEATAGLGTTVQEVYAHATADQRDRLLASTPVILALFDGSGGWLLLHTPGGPPLQAPPVPDSYRQLKDLAHVPVAAFRLATSPGHFPPETRTRLAGTLTRASAGLASAGIGPEEARAGRALLDLCGRLLARLDSGRPAPQEHTERFASSCTPLLLHLIEAAAAVQVGHWTTVLDTWQTRLGGALDDVYAAVNTLYVTRTKNVLFTVLAQYLGEAAIGERLFLFETPEFTTTPDRMLDLLTRIVADRELGRAFFGHSRVMDVELMGDATRTALREEMARRGRKAVLPTSAPYDTRQWPWATDPTSGIGPSTLAASHPDR
ncbi:hypothetical protein ACIQWR_38850 [Streptomyces sp. NPDC098789]|uniref:hypothetical protein n=1 Tax=Streptomyces sp. NPDC098789 TaxID=3366098 RepID=UPI00380F3995